MGNLSEKTINVLAQAAIDQFMYEHADSNAEAHELRRLKKKFREILATPLTKDAGK